MNTTYRSPVAMTVLGALALSLAGCGGRDGTPAAVDFGSATPIALAAGNPGADSKEYRSDGTSTRRIAIVFKNGVTATTISNLKTRNRVIVEHQIPQIGAVSGVIPPDTTPEIVLAQLRSDPSVLSVEPLHQASLDVLSPEDLPVNDPLFSQQYALERVSAAKAWEVTQGVPQVKIAVLDTGADLNHPDLKEKLLPGYNVQAHDQPPMDDYGHGTHTAGIAGAIVNNATGIAGMAVNCKIIPVKVLQNGSGNDVSISEGIVWAADHGADVISMSLRIGPKSAVAEKALKYALDKNVVVVASAGNESRRIDPVQAPRLPATFPGVIAVVATDQNDRKADFSNFGPAASVSAPGVQILSTYLTSQGGETPGYTLMSGTSMACPLVGGLAGLIRSQIPGASPAEVKKRLETTADKVNGQTGFDPNGLAWGRVNAFQAVQVTVTRRR